LHEDVNLVKKKPSPFRFDEKAWDRMKYFFSIKNSNEYWIFNYICKYLKSDAEKSKEHWDMNLRTDNSRISGIIFIRIN